MGMFQSCLRKKVVSEEEEAANKQMRTETERQLEDNDHKETLHRVAFGNVKIRQKSTDNSTPETNALTDVVKAKGGVAFNVTFQSTVPKLPPIFMTNSRVLNDQEFEKWKGMVSLKSFQEHYFTS
jgi:hypothetical protein